MAAASARCQLYLVAPNALPNDFAATLSAVSEAAEIACLRLPALLEVKDLVRFGQGRGTAVLLDAGTGLAGIELAATLGADGVHLPTFAGYAAARRQLGADAIVGVHCDGSRHQAMEAAEAGANYVSLEADLELVNWWTELMVVPVVVELGGALDRAVEFAAAGAEFIAVGGDFWRNQAGDPAIAHRLAAAISRELA